MADDHGNGQSYVQWMRLHFAIVQELLAASPTRKELIAALQVLAQRRWKQNELIILEMAIERWIFQERNEGKGPKPMRVHRRRFCRDAGQMPSLEERIIRALTTQYGQHRTWNNKPHYDNQGHRSLIRKTSLLATGRK
ncbi:MAG: hypothetical protein V2A73_15075 [Pseudomonadota bacterium]